MRALIIKDKNTPPVVEETDIPVPDSNQVLVKIYAAALNHRDVWIQRGQYAGLRYPIILGSDGAGTVEKILGEIGGITEGMDVVINPSLNWDENELVQPKDFKILGLPDNGTFAEYVAVPAKKVHKMPAHLNYAQAAALPLAGLTAYRAIIKRAQLQKNEKVLITGIGGGVALFALQFALAQGAEVWVTSSSDDKLKQAKKLGAAGKANYTEADWAKNLKENTGGFDVIIDGAGGKNFAQLTDLAAPAARIVIYGGTAGAIENLSAQRIFWKQLNIMGSTMGSENDFKEMLQFVGEHKIKPVIDNEFPLKDGALAFQRMGQSNQFGKIVLKIG